MVNSLVACGGTGAHAALAMMRLHTLGYALGVFSATERQATRLSNPLSRRPRRR